MHPLEKFNYCPVCGSSHFDISSERSKKCQNCGFEYFLNPSAANVAFILNEKGELLVERRKNEPAKGTLDLPGGFCDIGESAEEGVTREVKEETGLEVTHARYIFSIPNVYLYSGMDIRTLDMFFICEVKDTSALKAGDDAAECMWIPLEEIRKEQFGLRSVRQGLYEFIEKHQR
ncbi:MAG: NUDIX domain-containing protein [Prevotella sp.]|jgi:mutator protein MutT|nr:NUDIX domain-containing protein [Prevotella sp.]MCI2079437.1 NUDIX domain-containing protein [Prevotella sp.]MCI2101303.1 NUDIX domain-containing protein [Prevotella sp.]